MTTTAAKNGGHWAFVPVALLGGLMTVVLGLVHLALTDPSFAVEDHYYSRALSWDEHLAAERRSAALGWQTDLQARRAPDGSTDLSVTLRDSAGVAVKGAHVEVEAFSVARSRKIVRASLAETADGVYRARFPTDRGGRWDFSLDATRGAGRFTTTLRRDVVEAQAR